MKLHGRARTRDSQQPVTWVLFRQPNPFIYLTKNGNARSQQPWPSLRCSGHGDREFSKFAPRRPWHNRVHHLTSFSASACDCQTPAYHRVQLSVCLSVLTTSRLIRSSITKDWPLHTPNVMACRKKCHVPNNACYKAEFKLPSEREFRTSLGIWALHRVPIYVPVQTLCQGLRRRP